MRSNFARPRGGFCAAAAGGMLISDGDVSRPGRRFATGCANSSSLIHRDANEWVEVIHDLNKAHCSSTHTGEK